MKIPDNIKVAGHIYKVVWDDERLSNKGLVGESDHHRNIIYMCKRYRGDLLSAKSEIEETFIHEIFHIVDANYNMRTLTEDEITRLSIGWYQVLKDNFKF